MVKNLLCKSRRTSSLSIALFNFVNIGVRNEAFADRLATKPHSRDFFCFAEESAKFPNERILDRKDHNEGEWVGDVTMQRLCYFACARSK